MEKDVKQLVEGYEKFIVSVVKIKKTLGAPGTTLSNSDLEEPKGIYKHRSFVGQLMLYNTKLGPDVANSARELAVHMSHHGPEHLKVLGLLIGYLKGKNKKGIIIRKNKSLKAVMF